MQTEKDRHEKEKERKMEKKKIVWRWQVIRKLSVTIETADQAAGSEDFPDHQAHSHAIIKFWDDHIAQAHTDAQMFSNPTYYPTYTHTQTNKQGTRMYSVSYLILEGTFPKKTFQDFISLVSSGQHLKPP